MKDKIFDYEKDWKYVRDHIDFLETDEEKDLFIKNTILAHSRL